jgi:plastocyanin
MTMHRMTRTLTTLAAASLLLAGCGGGSASSKPADGGSSSAVTTEGAPDAQTATIAMNDNLRFAPTELAAKVGTVTFTVKNVGQVPHNLHFEDQSLGKTGTIDGGGSEPLKVVFTKAGTYTFRCTFHSGMDGKVVVS